MNYTEQEFNELAAKSEGFNLDAMTVLSNQDGAMRYEDQVYGDWKTWNPYSDLNQLMPLAWKYGADPVAIGIKSICDNGKANTKEEQVQAIRDCLFSIWSENNG